MTIKELGKNIFSWIFSSWNHFLITLLCILSLVFFALYLTAKKTVVYYQKENTEYQNKIGELYKEKETYVVEVDDLKKLNSELYTEVKNLKDNPITVTKVETKIEYRDIHTTDTMVVHDTLNNTYTLPVEYADAWLFLKGKSTFNSKTLLGHTDFDSIAFVNNLYIDLIDKGNTFSFIAKSDNPYCKINSIEGYVLSPENSELLRRRLEQKWIISAGIGLSGTVIDKQISFIPAVHLTFGYKIFGF